MLKRLSLNALAALCLGLALTALNAPVAFAQHVVVLVNGSPITTFDIDQRTKLNSLSGQGSPTRDKILEDLIGDKLKLAEAHRYGLDVADADVDRAVAGMAGRMRLNASQFLDQLNKQGVGSQTLKNRVRAELAWSSLVRGRFPSAYQVDDSEIRDLLKEKNTEAETIGYDYTLRPVVLIVAPGSPAGAYEARMHEAEALRTSFNGCEDGLVAARQMRDVAVRAIVHKSSSDFEPSVRALLDTIDLGKLSKPEVTQQGVEMYAVCAKQQTKVDTPQKKDMREALMNKKIDEQSANYLQQIRRSAMIEYKQ